MAGSVATFSYDEGKDGAGAQCGVKKVILDWTSDASSGAVSGTTRKIVGRLIKATTDPGSTAPSDDYDITLTDEYGVNILTACQSDLTNRDTANSEETYFLVKDAAAGTPLAQSVHPVVCGPLTIAIASAGNSKLGQLVLYIATS